MLFFQLLPKAGTRFNLGVNRSEAAVETLASSCGVKVKVNVKVKAKVRVRVRVRLVTQFGLEFQP